MRGQATRWPQAAVVSALAGTHMGQDYKVNKGGGCCLEETDHPAHRETDFYLEQNKISLNSIYQDSPLKWLHFIIWFI